jgi:hypothetical protein
MVVFMVGSAETSSGPYKIVAKRLPIGEGTLLLDKIAGHLYVQILDKNNNVVAQVDGLAVDKKGNVKPVGEASDLLIAEVYAQNSVIAPIWNNHANHQSVVLYETNDKSDVEKAIKQIRSTSNLINSEKVNYSLLGNANGNSNTVFNDIVSGLQKVLPIPDAKINEAKSMGVSNPGVDNSILYKQEDIKQADKNPILEFASNLTNWFVPYFANGIVWAMEGIGFVGEKIAGIFNPNKDNVAQNNAQTQPETPKIVEEVQKTVASVNGFVPNDGLPNPNGAKQIQRS